MSLRTEEPVILTLGPETATELMTANPISIRDSATIPEAVELLSKRGISAAPVIDAAGRPVGVLSQSDVLLHEREKPDQISPSSDYYERADLSVRSAKVGAERALVRDLMTPAVFSVTPTTSAAKVVQEMVALKIHRLFVVDADGVLVGVISALDVLRHLVASEFGVEARKRLK